jgi:hypothetical protein
MIQFTPKEFSQVREAIAAAHLYMQTINPMLKQRHAALNIDQRAMVKLAPEAVAEGFNIMAMITHRENRDPESLEAMQPTKLTDIDTVAMRDELENVSALVLPDLVYQMVCVLGELPMYHETLTAEPITANSVARLMAWTWEGGRRYGVQQAMAILDTTTTEFKSGVDAVLNAALNGTLDLPSPEAEHKPGEVVPIDGAPSAADLDAISEEQDAADKTSGASIHAVKPN